MTTNVPERRARCTQPGGRRRSRGYAGPVARPAAQVLGQPDEQRTGNERTVFGGTDVVDGQHDVAAEKFADVGGMTAVRETGPPPGPAGSRTGRRPGCAAGPGFSGRNPPG